MLLRLKRLKLIVQNRRTAVAAIALTLGTAMITLGVLLGELREISAKGGIVCLECIGIG
jgi:hypothetical protein